MQKNISISVIIPVFQDKEGLLDTVNSLSVQEFPRDQYEVVIADNNSRDGTKQIAVELCNAYPDLIKVVHQDKIQGSYATRNAGIKIARGEICCFIDSDMTVSSDYLNKIYLFFSRNEVSYLGCSIRINGTRNAIVEKFNHLFAFPTQRYFYKEHFSVTAGLSVRKNVFDKIGLFDYRLESGGDQEFGHRVLKAGLTQSYCHDIVLYHPPRTSVSSLLKKELRKARGKIQMAYWYPERYQHHIRNFFMIKRYMPLRLSSVKKKGYQKKIDLSYFECFLLSILYSFIRLAGLFELIRQKCILRNRCLGLQGKYQPVYKTAQKV